MKMFLDVCLCVIMVCLLIGSIDQVMKLCQEKLTVVSAKSSFTGETDINMTYRHRLVILWAEVVLFVLLRWVVLRW